MSFWLREAWNGIEIETIRHNFETCFLGESLHIHIAHHEIYGRSFRARMAEMALSEPIVENQGEVDSESDPADIDDI